MRTCARARFLLRMNETEFYAMFDGDDAAEEARREAVKDAATAGLAMRSKIRRVFGTEDGKEVAAFIIDELCMTGSSAFDANPYVMAFKAGMQASGLKLKSILESRDSDGDGADAGRFPENP